VRKQVSLDIYGTALQNQKKSFRRKVERLLDEAGKCVKLHGPYDPSELGSMMASVDWVVMGSIWWENSPLVIQEAHKFGRPVICPDIGGMAEKVAGGRGGYTYRVGDAAALAALIRRLHADPDAYEATCARLPAVPDMAACLDAHLALYRAA